MYNQNHGVTAAGSFPMDARGSLLPMYRLVNLQFQEIADGRTVCVAELFHEQASIRVCWSCRQRDIRMRPGVLVAVCWSGRHVSVDGALRIERLVLLERPEAAFEMFDSVPHEWVRDRSLIARAKSLLDLLPRGMRHLFNAIFWDGQRFHRFLSGPSSMRGPLRERNGNLRHTIEVAEIALRNAEDLDHVSREVLLLVALLHDAGKANEYEFDRARNRLDLTERGMLVGHKLTALEWIAAAKCQYHIKLPETHYLSVIHALIAVRGAQACARETVCCCRQA